MVFPARRFSLIQQHMGYSPFCLSVGQQGNEKVNVNNFHIFISLLKLKDFSVLISIRKEGIIVFACSSGEWTNNLL